MSSRADERIKRSVLFAFVAVNSLHHAFLYIAKKKKNKDVTKRLISRFFVKDVNQTITFFQRKQLSC